MGKTLKDECSKCGAEMTQPTKLKDRFANCKMTITGYLCKHCGHWNNLKTRKWFRNNKAGIGNTDSR